MNKFLSVIAIVEGNTEKKFIDTVLAPYLGNRNIGIVSTLISKPGVKGGDVRFSRAQKDIRNFLYQRNDTVVTTFFDYYGLKEWPKLDSIKPSDSPSEISKVLCEATKEEIKTLLSGICIDRFVPYFAMHEFETLLFSDSEKLAGFLNIRKEEVDSVISSFGNDIEKINNSRETAPSKRIYKWNPAYRKTTDGIMLSSEIGIERMRLASPLFNSWLIKLERLTEERKF